MGMSKKLQDAQYNGFLEACEVFDLILKTTQGIGPKTQEKINEQLHNYAAKHILKNSNLPFNVMR